MSFLSFVYSAFFISLFGASQVGGFTFTSGTPSECDDLSVSWTGGTPPFQLLIIPVFGTPRNVSIPDTAFNSGQGSFSVTLPIQKNEQMVLTMSDSTGFNAGGTSSLMTVAPSKGGSCNSTDPGVAFAFQLNTALQQCRPFVFSGFDGAVQPVKIGVVIPGGTAFNLNPPVGSTDFTWVANVARGTSLIFFMTDSQGRQGGSSDNLLVTSSDDNSCINNQSPSSTINPSQTSSTSSSSSSSTTTSVGSGGTSMGAIAGTVIGGLLFVAMLVTLGLFFLKKRRNGSGNAFIRQSRAVDSDIDLTYDPSQAPAVTPFNMSSASYPYSPNTGQRFDASNPFLDNQFSRHQPSLSSYQSPAVQSSVGTYDSVPVQHGPHAQGYPPHTNYHSPPPDPFGSAGIQAPGIVHDSRNPTEQSSSQSSSRLSTALSANTAARNKAAMAGQTAYKPSRFIVHTDAEDELPPPNDEGVVELPPQYTERHGAQTQSRQNPEYPPGPPYPS